MCGAQSDHVRTHLYEIFVLPNGQISANILFNRILDGKHLSISLERHHLETERTDKKEVEKRFIIVAVANDVARLVFFGGAWVFRKRRASLFFFLLLWKVLRYMRRLRQEAPTSDAKSKTVWCVCVYEKKGREATRAPDSFFSTGALGALNDF